MEWERPYPKGLHHFIEVMQKADIAINCRDDEIKLSMLNFRIDKPY